MKLIRLRVANFGCVRSADVDFGPHLNVLYGRNDLGKSSLVAAIRAALFLQHDSSVHRPYVTWQGGERPHVELTLQTESRRYYRIRKTFGSKGRSILEESRDGTTFLNPIKGRQVDGVIRSQLLPWGIPEPGGKRRERSMPSSFLSAALLAEQTAVTELFDRQLDSDADESGKQLLSDALQASAREPLFTDVLVAAQSKVDEAFTATGRRKRGRASPFHQVAQDISRTKATLDEMRLEAEASARIRTQLAELDDRLLASHGACQDAQAVLATATAVGDKQAELAAAEAELARVQTILDAAQAAQVAQAEAFDRAEALRERRDASDEAVRAATEALTEARARAVEVKNSATGQRARLQDLDIERGDIERRLSEARRRQQAAERVQQASEGCAELAREIAELESDDQAMLARIRDREELAEKEADLHVLNGVALLLRWRDADEKLAESYDAAVELAILMTEVEDARNQADDLEASLARRAFPDHETLAHLRELAAQLRIAEGALAVGLSALVESAIGLRVEVIRDGGDTEDLGAVSGQAEVIAEREMTLVLPNLATIRITGGNDMNRARLRRMRARWRDEAEPVLQAAGVDSLDELDALRLDYDKELRRLIDLREQADKHWDRAEMLRQRLIDAEPLRSLRADLDEQLDAYDRDHVSDRIEMLEDELADSEAPDMAAALKDEMDALAWDTEALRDRVQKAQVAAAEDKARLDGLRARAREAEAELADLVAALSEPWQDILDQSHADIADCQARLRALESERKRVLTEADDSLELAESAVRTAEEGLATAEAKRAEIHAESERARSDLARLNYECEHKTELAEKTDIDQCRQRVRRLTRELQDLRAQLPADTAAPAFVADALDDFLARLQTDHERLQRETRDIEREREQALGALRETGGERLREKLHDTEAQCQRLEKRQIDLEFDYDAWKLLLATMREVEKEQAAHLGRAMVEPITRRFRELTASRYGALDLGPNLETHGIHAGGERRDVALLSMGTKEQLSTLFRLSLAETLGSAVLLDDQLTQTDPERMGWFRQRMRELGRDNQIIVFTCRADDYLDETSEHNGDNNAIHIVGLDTVIDRV